MSEASLPFNEKYSPSTAKVSSGEKRKQEWEKSIKNPQEFWAEKAKAIDWFKPSNQSTGRFKPTVLQVVPRRRTQHLLQRPRQTRKNRHEKQTRLHLGRRNGRSQNLHLLPTLQRSQQTRQSLQRPTDSKKATASQFTCQSSQNSQSLCLQPHASAESTQSSSQASALKHSQTASTTLAQKSSSQQTALSEEANP